MTTMMTILTSSFDGGRQCSRRSGSPSHVPRRRLPKILVHGMILLSSLGRWYIVSSELIPVTGKTDGADEEGRTVLPLVGSIDRVSAKNADERRRLHQSKMELWRRGFFSFPAVKDAGMLGETAASSGGVDESLESVSTWMRRLGPVKSARRGDASCSTATKRCVYDDDDAVDIISPTSSVRDTIASIVRGGGGSDSGNGGKTYIERLEEKLSALGQQYGPEFQKAIELNKVEHKADCEKSCKSFYCADGNTEEASLKDVGTISTFASYSMGAVPPEDFADEFGFPLDLIKVSDAPLFPSKEASRVVSMAEDEGLSGNEYRSGKYKLGGDWLVNLPNTRAWFNERLEKTFFPLLATLFPEIVSSTNVLRAHSVSLLKYNSSHPRTDVHIDNGILAMTIAMTPKDQYDGGGTFFEHMGDDNVIEMDVGHGTFRPGSVRHGGHRVTDGSRYILGAFLLLEDRVEHVRRLKNRGSDLRKKGDLEGAEKHFEWAVAINPKCTTCLKDWAEVMHARKDFTKAEAKVREALGYLEDLDSDALFNLGMILSEQGKDEESIEAYSRSIALNAEDAELCYNLGIKLGAKGDTKRELEMYQKASEIEPNFGGPWINWGTVLAEQGDMDGAEQKFLHAVEHCPDVRVKAMMNLALVYHARGNAFAMKGDLAGAKVAATKASKILDDAKRIIDQVADPDDDMKGYATQYKPLRLQSYKLMGQVFAGLKDYDACEAEFRAATECFQEEPAAWHMLSRILEVQGKVDEAKEALEKAKAARAIGGALGGM